jgi:hypothetical protein
MNRHPAGSEGGLRVAWSTTRPKQPPL